MFCQKNAVVFLTAGLLASCSHAEPGVEVRTVEVVKEVPMPCAAERPERPSKLPPLPDDAVRALALALAKLGEWSAPGMYGDRAESYFNACPNGE